MKKFFAKRFRTYFFLMLFPTLLVFAISLYVTNRQINQKLDTQARNTLSNVNINLDSVIKNALYQNMLQSSNSGTLLALKRIMSKENDITYNDAIYLRNIQTTLRSLTQTYSYIDSVYFYLDGYDSVLTSDKGPMSLSLYPDMSWLDTYHQMSLSDESEVSRRTIQNPQLGQEQEVLTFYNRMLLTPGLIVMNIDIDEYKENLKDIFPGKYESLIFFDRKGKSLLTWTWDGKDDVINEKLIDDVLESTKQNSQKAFIRLNQSQYMLHKSRDPIFGMEVVSLISKKAKMEDIRNLSGIFVAILFINIMLVLLIAYRTTERNFKQIRYMIQVFDEAEKGFYPNGPRKKMQDEYDIIMNNIIYVFLNTVQLNSQLKEKAIEQERTELAALQLQINPHFLYNTLQSVEFEIQKAEGKNSSAAMVIQELSDILKYSLSDPLSMVPLNEEISYLKKYVEIQRYRFGDRFITYYEIEDEFQNARIIRLLLQPLIENSILHGVRNVERKGYIKIKVFKRNDELQFYVLDNGCGMTKAELEGLYRKLEDKNTMHIGLSNVNSRLILRYGEDSKLHIMSKKDMGCCITFAIPYIA